MEKRKCKLCGEEKILSEFASAGTISGKKYFRYKCIPCYSKFKNIRKSLIRKQYYEIKKGFKCCNCGNDDFRVLEFDHINRNKKELCISEAMGRGCSLEKIKKEIDKCQVLCANCHRIKTWEEGIGKTIEEN